MDRAELFGDVALGEVIGGYRLERLLGAGSTSQVFLGTHVLLGRTSAIKVLAAPLIGNKEVVSRLLTEARVVNDIRHPNIIDIMDFVVTEAPPRVALVMEYIEGVSLKAIRETPLTYDQALGVALQLAEAVQAAHSAGVIHRDLKPDNLLLTPDPRLDPAKIPVLKIVDFGIAKLAGTGGKTATGMMLGTPAYMAPEQVAGRPPPSAATDVFAIGEVIYELLTGKRAYPAAAIHETVRAKLRGELPDVNLPPVPGAGVLQPLIIRCIALKPQDRPPLTEVRETLFGLMSQPSAAAVRGRLGTPSLLNVPEAATVLAPRAPSRGSGPLAGSAIAMPRVEAIPAPNAPAGWLDPPATKSGGMRGVSPAPAPAMTELSESPIRPQSAGSRPGAIPAKGTVTDEITSPADLLAGYARAMQTQGSAPADPAPLTVTRPVSGPIARLPSDAYLDEPALPVESPASAARTEQFTRPDFSPPPPPRLPVPSGGAVAKAIPPAESSPTHRVMPSVTIAATSAPGLRVGPDPTTSDFPATPASLDVLETAKPADRPENDELRSPAQAALAITPPEAAAQGLLQPAGMSRDEPSRPEPIYETKADSVSAPLPKNHSILVPGILLALIFVMLVGLLLYMYR